MVMKTINSEKYTATITIGLQNGYTERLWNKSDVIYKLQAIQNQFIELKKIYLSAVISECDVVLSGQIEPSLKIDIINYPKFSLTQSDFKKYVSELTKRLMKALCQNRIVIIFNDSIAMLEENDKIDPRIINPTSRN